MSLTNEDRDLIDRQADHELDDQEQALYREKLTQNEEFRRAVVLHELIEERAQVVGREQLKNRLKDDLRTQRAETAADEHDAVVRPMFGTPIKWAIAASVIIALAAALFIMLPQWNSSSNPPVAGSTEQPDAPVTGQQAETPTYGEAEVYGQYDITTEGAEMIQAAILQVDTSRPAAQFQMRDGTLYVYYPTELPEDAQLELNEENDLIFVTIEDNTYQIDPVSLSSGEAQDLELVE